MRKKMLFGLTLCLGLTCLSPLTTSAQVGPTGATGKFDVTINKTTEQLQDDKRIDAGNVGGANSVNELIFKIINNIAIPLFILAGITLAIVGFYMMMFKESGEEISKGTRYVIWGVVGVIIMISARYMGNALWAKALDQGSLDALSGIELSDQIYSMILYPILKIGIYIMMGVLFIIMLTRVFSFLASDEGAIQDKSLKIIGTNVLGILIIMGAKQLVEAVYGKREDVINENAISNLGQLGGGGILADKNIPILYHVIEWIMGLSAFIVLVIIIVQTFRLLAQPTKEEQIQTIKKTILYVALGILVIGAGYIATNFLVVT